MTREEFVAKLIGRTIVKVVLVDNQFSTEYGHAGNMSIFLDDGSEVVIGGEYDPVTADVQIVPPPAAENPTCGAAGPAGFVCNRVRGHDGNHAGMKVSDTVVRIPCP